MYYIIEICREGARGSHIRRSDEMTVKYDTKKLKRIVCDIQALIGVSISVMNTEKKIICEGENNDEFCERICSFPEGRTRCECSDGDLIEKCAKEGRAVSHICHAGILDTAVPIIKDSQTVGYIFIGRLRPYPKPENIFERLFWLGDSREEVESRYLKLTYFTQEQLTAMISLVSNIIFDSAIEIEYDGLTEAAASYIAKNLDTPLDVPTLCEKLYVSKNRLYEGFSKSFGKTVNEYIWDERIKRAKALLLSTDMSTADISQAVGIDNSAYFAKIFKEKTGLSPAAFRKINAAAKQGIIKG